MPFAGFSIGFLIGLFSLYFSNSLFTMVLAILIGNVVWWLNSRLKEAFIEKSLFDLRRPLKIKKIIPLDKNQLKVMDLTDQKREEPNETLELSAEEILKRIDINEVFGYGGAAFPVIKKIRTVLEANVTEKHLIINGIECDPGLIHDQWLLQNFSKEVEKGIKALCRCITFKGVFLGVKDNSDLHFSKEIDIVQTTDWYPAGAEKILIKRILKKEIPFDEVPAMNGILVLNVQTVFAIYEAVYLNRKADTRYLTVSNMKKKKSLVVKVKLGEKIRDISLRVFPEGKLVFSGGGCMQAHLIEDDELVQKTTNFIAVADFPNYKESLLCSRCGLCSSHCPIGLKVNQIVELVDKGKLKETVKLQPDKCLSCGSCSYLCLAGRNLAAKVKEAKEYIQTM